ncbi:MAG TPA: PEP-CTERM sorting domain-containing protein [Acetobacteraceae bacterium]|nr:PEP-CTERM sorting domain-containing protein [Acetobacteraceae bacterium]
MRNKLLAAGAMVMALGFGARAQAGEMASFTLSGEGISASASIMFTLDTIVGDPVGANNIISISGLFSDSNVGISNATITGLIPTDPNPANSPFATSLSRVPVAGTLLPPDDSNSLTYSNLFYPFGAPDTCFDGITGGYFDVFGALFTLSNGDEVDVWSNGGGPNDSAMYGVAVAEPGTVDSMTVYTAIDYVSDGVTMDAPEPGSFWLLCTALLGALAFTRRPSGPRREAPAPG